MYRPTIFIQKKRDDVTAQFELSRQWAGIAPPRFTNDFELKPDAAFFRATTSQELLDLLPILLQLHSESIPVLLLCDNQEELSELTSELDIVIASTTTDGPTASGIIFGMLQRQDEVSILRSKVGLMSMMQSNLQEDIDKINEELNSAASLQKEFISSDTSPLHGMHFNALWRPTGVVSGDIYDITKLGDNHISFFIADAIGHGMPAALLSVVLSKTLSSCRTTHEGEFTEPCKVLKVLNEALLDRNGTNARFATAIYGIIDCKTRSLTLAGAGHPPALWIQSNNKTTLLDSKGPLLGVFTDESFVQETVTLGDNDRVVFYSDGFEEVLTANSTTSDLPTHLQAICNFGMKNDNIIESVSNYLNQNAQQTDDLTMLCLHTTSSSVRLAA
ncbi:serine/threonine-protein phosphatase [PVC group bacterium]|nr:serine/threonine-protein phosphatase [PVC group bacterium]